MGSILNQYLSRHGYGRIALTAAALTATFVVHLHLLLSPACSPLLWRWSLYAMAMSFFHFAEFAWACS
jgi:hypothetical protein